nr:IclR family transcriptional regulator C-terminal domain-containing protein [Nocardiopsis alba]
MPPREQEREEVTQARSRGYAITHGEVTHAVSGVSAPVVGRQGKPVAAVGVSVLELKDPEAIGVAVAEAARRLAVLLPQA